MPTNCKSTSIILVGALKVTTSAIALIIIAMQFGAGCLIGILSALLILRTKLTQQVALIIALVTGLALELAVGCVGYVSWHQAFSSSSIVEQHLVLIAGTVTIVAALSLSLVALRRANRTARRTA